MGWEDFYREELEYVYYILNSIYKEKYSGKANDDLNTHIDRFLNAEKNIKNANTYIEMHNRLIENKNNADKFNKKHIKDLEKMEKVQSNEIFIIENLMTKKITLSDVNNHIRKFAFGTNIIDRISDDDFSLDNAVQRTNSIRSSFISAFFNGEAKETIKSKALPKKVYENMLLKIRDSYIASSPKTKSNFQQFSNYTKKEVAKGLQLLMPSTKITSILEKREKKLFGVNANTKFNTLGKLTKDIVPDDKKIYAKITTENIKEYAKLLKDMKEIIGAKPWYKKIFNSKHNEQLESLNEAKKALTTKGVDEKALNDYLNASEKDSEKMLSEMINKSADSLTRFGFENSKRQGLIPDDMTYEQVVEKQLEHQNKQKEVEINANNKNEKNEKESFPVNDNEFVIVSEDEIDMEEETKDNVKVNESTKDNVRSS